MWQSEQARPLSHNITKEERAALKILRKEQSTQIMPADKGKATVMMDKEEYDIKVQLMLEDEKTFVKLDKDSTHQYKRKLVVILTQLNNEGKLSEQKYKELYPT